MTQIFLNHPLYTHTQAWIHLTEIHKYRSFLRLYHTTFKPAFSLVPPLVRSSSRAHHPLLSRFPPRRKPTTWLFFDGGFDIDTLYPPRIHYRFAEQYTYTYTNALHPRYTGRLALDGYIRDCDLRYRKLLSKARPKTRGGCIKFLNSSITATCRRCLPALLLTHDCTKKRSL